MFKDSRSWVRVKVMLDSVGVGRSTKLGNKAWVCNRYWWIIRPIYLGKWWIGGFTTPSLRNWIRNRSQYLIVFVLIIDLSVIRDPGERGPSQEQNMMRLLFVVSSGTGLLHSWLSLIWRSIVNFSITNKMIPTDCNKRYQILNCPLINVQTLASTWPPDCSICNLMKMI